MARGEAKGRIGWSAVVLLSLVACEGAELPLLAPGMEQGTAAPPPVTLAQAPAWTGGESSPMPCLTMGHPDAPGGLDSQGVVRMDPAATGTPDAGTCQVAVADPLTGTSGGPDEIPTIVSRSTAPAAPTLVSPNSQVGSLRPTFTWNASSTATWYYLFIRDGATATGTPRVGRWVTATSVGCAAGTGTCSWTADLDMSEGSGIWWIYGWNEFGPGPWSAGMSYSILLTASPPPAPTQVAPNSEVATNRPTMTWNAVSDATWYRVFVRDSGTQTGAARINLWVTASTAGCAGGTGTCSWTANTDLTDGSAQWWVQAWRDGVGAGSWSPSMAFSVSTAPSPPAAPTLVSPNSEVTENRPTFTWNAVTGSTWYKVFIRDGATATGAPRVERWVTAADVGCGSETGTCSWTVDTDLSNGAGTWWVQGWGPDGAGAGAWSTGMAFSVNVPSAPPAAVLVAPSGSTENRRPEFQWNAVASATHYLVYIRDASTPGGALIDQEYTAADVNCGGGTGTCTYTPGVDLAFGSGVWWIRTRNAVGEGPWSTSMSFNITAPVPPAATLVSPSGTIADPRPTFTWNAVSEAASYQLFVRDGSTPSPEPARVNQEVTPTSVGCSSGTGTCSWTPDFDLAFGAGSWFIQTKNVLGDGPWSSAMSFDYPNPSSLELSITSVHLNQGAENPLSAVGGVAGRAGFVRVVVTANEANSAQPPVRLQLYQGATLIGTHTINAPGGSVPLSPNLDVTTDTWNLPISGGSAVAGLRVVAEVDPDETIPVANRDNARFPATGTHDLGVQTVPDFNVVFFPVREFRGSELPNPVDRTTSFTAGDVDAYMTASRRWLPIVGENISVRSVFTTPRDLSDFDNGWLGLLDDINIVRGLESAGSAYYHAIVPTFSGIASAGVAYRPDFSSSTSRAAISYDRQDVFDPRAGTEAAVTIAHEFAHNLGRPHNPGCGAGGAVADFPYLETGAGGDFPKSRIGVTGFDVLSGEVVPTLEGTTRYDYMSYCGPLVGTSDYTFRHLVNWRRTDALASPVQARAFAGPSLLVAGSWSAGSGAQLRPAFSVEAAAVLPDRSGPAVVRGVAADGRELFRLGFQGVEVSQGDDPTRRHFTFVIPMSLADQAALERIELVTPNGSAVRVAGDQARSSSRVLPEIQPRVVGDPGVQRSAAPGAMSRLTWDADRHPMVIVRDPATGHVLSMGESGMLNFQAPPGVGEVEVLISDGVRTRREVR